VERWGREAEWKRGYGRALEEEANVVDSGSALYVPLTVISVITVINGYNG